MTLETVRPIALTGVERIAARTITHSAPALDISLDISTNTRSKPSTSICALSDSHEHPLFPYICASWCLLSYRTAGESHGKALIALIEGLPAGVPVDKDFIDMLRRRQGHGCGGRQRSSRTAWTCCRATSAKRSARRSRC